MGLDPNGLKLLTALFVLAAMVIPRATRGWFHSRPSLEGRSV
jgi:ABC-type uncharacterized transport system permease subunit